MDRTPHVVDTRLPVSAPNPRSHFNGIPASSRIGGEDCEEDFYQKAEVPLSLYLLLVLRLRRVSCLGEFASI